MRQPLHLTFLNVGHFLDHYFMLIFATVAALALTDEWGIGYGELIVYATPGFIAFGACAIPAGWLADRWSREGMITVFFLGIGISSVLTAAAATPVAMTAGLLAIGVFAAIYHPVGIALVLEGEGSVGMRVAVNGVWGNLGVAAAALVTAGLIDVTGWRAAFIAPGLFSILIGIAYGVLVWRPAAIAASLARNAGAAVGSRPGNDAAAGRPAFDRVVFIRVLSVILFTTALGGLVYQSTTFALPKVFDERASSFAGSATMVGWLTFATFAIGSMGQIIVGRLVDRHSPRTVFMSVAALQVLFFSLMIGATGAAAFIAAVGFMLAAFGQISINDVLVGRVAKSAWRSRILAVRYTTTITVMALSVPFIGWIYDRWGFDRLFLVLAATAALVFCAVATLPALSQDKPKAAPVPAE
ncbi:MAG: MFS transporter [Rhizobiales bacterium]|nr:MFS transporter [Hyphomicrobiales bacterium]